MEKYYQSCGSTKNITILRPQFSGMRMRVYLAFLITLIFTLRSVAQGDSACGLRISVLTCSPGNELYSIFGHSALRITDTARGTDIIYNWGTFDFDEPDFYTKFMRGKLLYYLSPDRLREFLYVYQYEGRSVFEQVLDISCAEKQRISKAVTLNMQGDNRYYKYDFLFDNCTTRIRDILQQNIGNLSVHAQIVPEGTTFRNMLYAYLDRGGQAWSKLGIDILLGSRIDREVTNDEAQFLPEYLMMAVDSSMAGGHPTVGKKNMLISANGATDPSGLYTPLIYTGLFALVLVLISLVKSGWAATITRFADSLLLYLTGLLGILLLFMWFFTDHGACADNYNLLWALPFNIFAAFSLWKQHSWVKMYFKLAAVISAVILLTWALLPQQLNIALIPIILLMLYRYVKLSLK